MADYINRDNLIKHLANNAKYRDECGHEKVINLDNLITYIKSLRCLELKDVQVDHGHWLKYNDEIYECSKCGYYWYLTNLATHPKDNNAFYCPECGTEMDLGV